MAAERRLESGRIFAWHAAVIVAKLPFTAEILDPEKLNPFREFTAEPKAMKDLKEWQKRRAWRSMFTPPGKREE